MLLHHAQELNDHLRRGAEKNLALTAALSIDDAHEGVVLCDALVTFTTISTYQNRDPDHIVLEGSEKKMAAHQRVNSHRRWRVFFELTVHSSARPRDCSSSRD